MRIEIAALFAATSTVAIVTALPRNDIDEVMEPPDEEPEWNTESFR